MEIWSPLVLKYLRVDILYASYIYVCACVCGGGGGGGGWGIHILYEFQGVFKHFPQLFCAAGLPLAKDSSHTWSHLEIIG